MNGVVNINKPAGITSHDVVGRLRKIFNIKKIGHTGTLDPDACGVLPMCIGRATKAADMLTAKDKQYIAEVSLGKATDTLDSSGTVTETAEVNVSLDEIKSTASEFVGDIMQIPPMYSAIKVNGKKLCDMARGGEVIERTPRSVRIDRIDVLSFDEEKNKFKMLVDCSKGTYIRTLCDDIGRKLGCFAHMSALTRTKSGKFCIENSYSLDEVEKMYLDGDLSFLIPLDDIFSDYQKLTIAERKAKKMCNGTQVNVQGAEEGRTYRVYDEKGNFLTISTMQQGVLKIEKTFYQALDGE